MKEGQLNSSSVEQARWPGTSNEGMPKPWDGRRRREDEQGHRWQVLWWRGDVRKGGRSIGTDLTYRATWAEGQETGGGDHVKTQWESLNDPRRR